MRIRLSLIFIFLFALPAMAEPVFFVNVIEIGQGKQARYEDFLNSVAPIRKKHGIEIIARARIVDLNSYGGVELVPHEVEILWSQNKQAFMAFESDTEYLKIKLDRLNAVESHILFEGKAVEQAGLKYLKNVPMAAIVLSNKLAKPSKVSLTLEIQSATPVKGSAKEFARAIKSVQIHAVSFDDNPMGYMPDQNFAGKALGLVGELVR